MLNFDSNSRSPSLEGTRIYPDHCGSLSYNAIHEHINLKLQKKGSLHVPLCKQKTSTFTRRFTHLQGSNQASSRTASNPVQVVAQPAIMI